MAKYNEIYVEVNKIINESPIDTFCIFWETDVYFKDSDDNTIYVRTHDKVLSNSEAYLNNETIPTGTYSIRVYIDYVFNDSDIVLRTVEDNILDSMVYSNDSLANIGTHTFTYSCDDNDGIFEINVNDVGKLGNIKKKNTQIYNTNLNELDNFVTKEPIYYDLIVATQGYVSSIKGPTGVPTSNYNQPNVPISNYNQTKIPSYREDYIEWLAEVNKVVPFYKDIAVKDYVFGVKYTDLVLR